MDYIKVKTQIILKYTAYLMPKILDIKINIIITVFKFSLEKQIIQ